MYRMLLCLIIRVAGDGRRIYLKPASQSRRDAVRKRRARRKSPACPMKVTGEADESRLKESRLRFFRKDAGGGMRILMPNFWRSRKKICHSRENSQALFERMNLLRMR